MNKKRLLAAFFVLALVVGLGSIGLAGNETYTATVTVLDTHGSPVDGAEVKLYEDDHETLIETKTTVTDGIVTFTELAGSEHGIEYIIDAYKDHMHGHVRFHVHETDVTLAVYLLNHNETDVHFSVSGFVGVLLEVEDGHNHWLPDGGTEFGSSSLWVELQGMHGEGTKNVTLSAFTVDGEWQLVLGGAPDAAGKLGIKYSTTDDNWENAGWFGEGVDGNTETLVVPTQEGGSYQRTYFYIKGVAGEGTADTHGRVIFRAEL